MYIASVFASYPRNEMPLLAFDPRNVREHVADEREWCDCMRQTRKLNSVEKTVFVLIGLQNMNVEHKQPGTCKDEGGRKVKFVVFFPVFDKTLGKKKELQHPYKTS